MSSHSGGTKKPEAADAGAKRNAARRAAGEAPKGRPKTRVTLEDAHAQAHAWQEQHPEAGKERVPILSGKTGMAKVTTKGNMLVPQRSYSDEQRRELSTFDHTRLLPSDVQHLKDSITVFGERQFGALLRGFSPATIRTAYDNVRTAYPDAGMPKNGGNYASRISWITRVLTNGHFSADFRAADDANAKRNAAADARKASAKATRAAARTANPTASGAKRGAAASRAPLKELVPIVPAGTLTYNRDDAASAYTLQRLYGNSQLRDALDGLTLRTLKEMAGEVMQRNPGTRPSKMTSTSAVIDYITQQLGAK